MTSEPTRLLHNIALDRPGGTVLVIRTLVAKRFGWYESTAGWCHIIVQECGGDECKALDRFFELVEEYRQSGQPEDEEQEKEEE